MFVSATTSPMGGALSAAGPGSSALGAGVMSSGGGGATNESDPLGTTSSIAPEFGGGKIGDVFPDGGDPPPSTLESAPSLITLDMNHGTVLFEGHAQIGIPGEAVDVRAQVRVPGGGSPTYSWDTSGLANAVSISGTATHRLQFDWEATPTFPPGVNFLTNTATLTVTVGSQSVQQTYTFLLPRLTANPAATAPPTWSNTLDPGLVVADAPVFAGHNVAVSAATGAVETALALPTYSPNFAPLVLQYSSLYADARPIIVGTHELTTSPTQVTAQLTFDGVTGGTSTYDTMDLVPGDILQVASQANATALATGRYDYSLALNVGATTTYTGTASVVNGASGAVGAGWSVAGVNRITVLNDGVLLDLGAGRSLWYAGSGTYTSQPGDFSTLRLDRFGNYIRTLKDGSTERYDPASGLQTSVKGPSDVGLTCAYDTSNRLSAITDTYSDVTTFTYDANGLLASITDPANRVTTFTHTGTKLTSATLPLSTAWSFAYDTAGKLTSVTDPRAKVTSLTYDGAGRASTSTRPDSTTQTFTAWQTAGFVAGAGAVAATLRAEATATHTNPLSHTSTLRFDWAGLGLINQAADPLDNKVTLDLDVDGSPLATIDPLDRVTQAEYDSQGNAIEVVHPDLAIDTYTYNTLFSKPLTYVDALGNQQFAIVYSSTGLPISGSIGNSPMSATYSGTGRLLSYTDGANNTTTYVYDSRDRLTSVTAPNNDAVSFTYDTYGNRQTVTDGLNHTTTTNHDALNRVTSVVDALNHTTSYAYDASSNLLSVTDPLSHVTSATYSSMNRVLTVTDAASGVVTYAYDNAGRMTSLTDPVGNVTSWAFDAADRVTSETDPRNKTRVFTRDAAGQTTRQVDRNGRPIDFTYDERGSLTSEVWRDTMNNVVRTIVTTFDLAGRMTAMSDPDASLTFGYDDANRLTSATSKEQAGNNFPGLVRV